MAATATSAEVATSHHQPMQQQQPTTATNDNQPNEANSGGQSTLDSTTCMELALEGERLCKTGDFKAGIRFFEEALNVGTSDDRTLSAIYSQLGNAYFYLEDYEKALDYHKRDVNLVNAIGDETAEAKACGNLGNTYKMLAKYDEAAVYCRRYLELSKKSNDLVGEARALYNLGNVYHTQGKRLIGAGSESELCEPSKNVKISLERAIDYYEANLELVTRLQDYASMGRAYGNLGNTHYLLGNFDLAVQTHTSRLQLARQTNDKAAERRACLNLGNANVFQGNYPEAIENYSNALKLAQELRDKYTEAHSCYVLANTYTFLRDYKSAINYHLRYLDMIKDLDDKLGEGRACSSLVNLYQMIDEPEMALVYARKHHELAEQLGDTPGMVSARMNIEELQMVISQRLTAANQQQPYNQHQHQHHHHQHHHQHRHSQSQAPSDNPDQSALDKRQEQEQRRFKKQLNSNLADIDGLAARRKAESRGTVRSNSSERLFDMIAHFQSGRIDDQRCEISTPMFSSQQIKARPQSRFDNKENTTTGAPAATTTTSRKYRSSSQESAEIGSSSQQPKGNGGSPRGSNPLSAAASAIKASYRKASLINYPTSVALPLQSASSIRRPTVAAAVAAKVSSHHQEKLFDLIAGAQRQRMDEQRASLPALNMANGLLAKTTTSTINNSPLPVGQPHLASSTKFKPSTGAGQVSRRLFGSISKEPARGGSFDKPTEVIGPRRDKSNSVVAQNFITPSAGVKSSSSSSSSSVAPSAGGGAAAATTEPPKRPAGGLKKELKFTKHFQTFDADSKLPNDNFLDSLMRYQSTRFNDQRSEFPKITSSSGSSGSSRLQKVQSTATESTTISTSSGSPATETSSLPNSAQPEDKDNFLDLIVRFQSDRIENQRSAPPPASRDNI